MKFELTEALIDDILFAMEDQDGEYYLDTVEGMVAGGVDGLGSYLDEVDEKVDIDDKDAEGGERFISLPEWDSASGFRLMERFISGFRNPMIREELSSALSRGKGVFRAFKNALSHHTEAEKLWFTFKEREMKREIVRWYNGLREEWGLEKIGEEPEETGDLVLEDFRFHPFREEDLPKAEELHRHCLEEHKKFLAERGAKNSSEILIRESQIFLNQTGNLFSPKQDKANQGAPKVLAISSESGGGEFAGYISGIINDSTFHIQTLEVKAEYRGLGIGEALLSKLIESLDHNEITQVLIDLPNWAEGFSRVLLRESFNPYTERYWLNLRERDH